MGPRWVAELPQDPAGSGGQSVLRKRDGGECAEGGRGRRQEWGSSVAGIQIYKAAGSESGLGVGQRFFFFKKPENPSLANLSCRLRDIMKWHLVKRGIIASHN